jgi:glyoxylase-like metal-dependent hydrolase (beta-lactamase superfamily II)
MMLDAVSPGRVTKMEMVPNIHRIDGVRAWPYLILGDELVLIDAGMSKNPSRILSYLGQTMKRQPSDIKTIIITHAHIDHTGGLARLVAATGAKVAIHAEDAPYLSWDKSMGFPKGAMGIMFRIVRPFIKPTPVKADILLNDGDTIAGMRVIHIPGHTPGSIALLDEKRKVLFPGDTLRLGDGLVVGPPAKFTLDPGSARRSIEKLKSLDFEVMLAGHGEPILAGASGKVREGRY